MVRDNNVKYIAKKIEDAFSEIANKSEAFPTVVFSCVDSMAVRKWIYERFSICPLFIDVRTGGQYVNIYSIRTALKDECQFYQDSLYTDEEAAPLPCTGTAIIDVAAAASAEAVNRFRLWTNNRLAIQKSFDDYSTGVHSLMKFKNLEIEIVAESQPAGTLRDNSYGLDDSEEEPEFEDGEDYGEDGGEDR
jgi:hypothetical protein